MLMLRLVLWSEEKEILFKTLCPLGIYSNAESQYLEIKKKILNKNNKTTMCCAYNSCITLRSFQNELIIKVKI